VRRVEVDRETLLPWVEVAHSSRVTQDVLGQVGEPLEGSHFDRINEMYPFERSSDWCRGYLSAALEHMELWAEHVAPLRFAEDAVVVHRFRPVQTLSRAAVEAASQAVWLMDGNSARECARRHLCLILHDLDEQRKAAVGVARGRIAEARATLLERLESAVSEEEIGRFAGYMETVKRASAVVAAKGSKDGGIGDPAEVERLWRASAGSAHGKRWPSVELQIVLPKAEIGPGHYATELIPDPDAITRILKLADAVSTYGVLRFADYSGYAPQLGSMLTGANERLSRLIPRHQ
jgi:hypothetical protein